METEFLNGNLGSGTGNPSTPAAATARWSSEQLVLLDHVVLDALGSHELLLAITDPSYADFGKRLPRLRIGVYIKTHPVYGKVYNTSMRLTVIEKITIGTDEYLEDVDYVAAGKSFGEPSGAQLRSNLFLLAAMLKYDMDSDVTTKSLGAFLDQGLAAVPGAGIVYTGTEYA